MQLIYITQIIEGKKKTPLRTVCMLGHFICFCYAQSNRTHHVAVKPKLTKGYIENYFLDLQCNIMASTVHKYS